MEREDRHKIFYTDLDQKTLRPIVNLSKDRLSKH